MYKKRNWVHYFSAVVIWVVMTGSRGLKKSTGKEGFFGLLLFINNIVYGVFPGRRWRSAETTAPLEE